MSTPTNTAPPLVEGAPPPVTSRGAKSADPDRPLRTASVIAGTGLALLTVLAVFGNFLVLKKLITPGDPATTMTDIANSPGLFRWGIASLLTAAILDVVVAAALLRLFTPVNRDISRLAAWFRIIYAGVFSVAVSQLVERSLTVEYTSLTRAGVPIMTPLTPFPGEGSIDVSTGLSYPAKAERARRNPNVSLLSDPVGSALGQPPVVLVQGLATVRDSDQQANTDRYVRLMLGKLPTAYEGVPSFLMRRLDAYFARIWVQVTPIRIWEWASASLDAPRASGWRHRQHCRPPQIRLRPESSRRLGSTPRRTGGLPPGLRWPGWLCGISAGWMRPATR